MIERLARMSGIERLPSEPQVRAALSGVRAALAGDASKLRALVSALLARQERLVAAEEAKESGGARDATRMHVSGDESASGAKTFPDGVRVGPSDEVYYTGSVTSPGDLVIPSNSRVLPWASEPDVGDDARPVPGSVVDALANLRDSGGAYPPASTFSAYDDAIFRLYNALGTIDRDLSDYERAHGRSLASDWADVRAVLFGAPASGASLTAAGVSERRRRLVSAIEGWLMRDDASTSSLSAVERFFLILLRVESLEAQVGSDFPDVEIPKSGPASEGSGAAAEF